MDASKFAIVGVQFTSVGGSSVSIQDFIKGVTGPIYDRSGAFMKTAPTIIVWDPTLGTDGGYVYYYYLSQTKDKKEGWADSSGVYVNEATILVGAGFWVKAAEDSFTINFK